MLFHREIRCKLKFSGAPSARPKIFWVIMTAFWQIFIIRTLQIMIDPPPPFFGGQIFGRGGQWVGILLIDLALYVGAYRIFWKSRTFFKVSSRFSLQPLNFKKLERFSQTIYICSLWENYGKSILTSLEGRKIIIWKNVTRFPEGVYAPT